jgi:hypothetical protein
MSTGEILNILPWIAFLIAAYLLSRFGVQWRMNRACLFVMRDLERREALGPQSAVELGYEKKSPLSIGLRDFRPKALADLVAAGIVGKTDQGRYFLLKRIEDLRN